MQVIRARAGDWIGPGIRLAAGHAIIVVATEVGETRHDIDLKCQQVAQAERARHQMHDAARRRAVLDKIDQKAEDTLDGI
jgi:hypothetical protein